MEKYIDVTKEVRQKAMKAFGITERTLFNALTFDSKRGDTDNAKRIRRYILQNGGVTMVKLPEMETIHDCDGYMRQYFPNGAMIEVDKKTGDATLFYKGEKIETFDSVFVWQLSDLQDIAKDLTLHEVEELRNKVIKKTWVDRLHVEWMNKIWS